MAALAGPGHAFFGYTPNYRPRSAGPPTKTELKEYKNAFISKSK